MIPPTLSVSQVEAFDHNQEGGCHRRFWFERTKDLRPEQTNAQSEGDAGHALLARYLRELGPPTGRVKMGKAVTGVIVKGDLPKLGPDLIVEERFSGQPKFDDEGEWLPLDVTRTLWLGGAPWEGFVDLQFRRGDVPEIWDHKFSSDVDAYAKPGSALIRTVQMPVYALNALRRWPDAPGFRLVHHYVNKTGVRSEVRGAVFAAERIRERGAEIEGLVRGITAVRAAPTQDDVAFNRRACSAWLGCPHQTICTAFRRNQVALTPEEEALFRDLDGAAAPAQPAAPAPSPDVDAEEAALEAALAAKRAAEAKAKADEEAAAAAARAKADAEAAEKKRKLEIRADNAAPVVPPAGSPPPADVPAPQPTAAVAAGVPPCACGTPMTPNNASKLQSGLWKHIGCPLDAPATTATPAAKKGKAATAPAPTPSGTMRIEIGFDAEAKAFLQALLAR